jgi:hypothetical protein
MRNMPFFGGEVKPRVKNTCKYEQKYFAMPNSSFPTPVPPASYQMTVGRIALLVDESSFRLLTSFYHDSPCSYVTWRLNSLWPPFR